MESINITVIQDWSEVRHQGLLPTFTNTKVYSKRKYGFHYGQKSYECGLKNIKYLTGEYTSTHVPRNLSNPLNQFTCTRSKKRTLLILPVLSRNIFCFLVILLIFPFYPMLSSVSNKIINHKRKSLLSYSVSKEIWSLFTPVTTFWNTVRRRTNLSFWIKKRLTAGHVLEFCQNT